MGKLPASFKANDIRGLVPAEFDEDQAFRIARAFAEELPEGGFVVVGRDARLESPVLASATVKGFVESGMNVVDIGACGTEEVYFHTAHRKAAGGVMITASHNPKGYNGMKLVREGSRPVGSESGLNAIGERAVHGHFRTPKSKGSISEDFDKTSYIDKLMEFVDAPSLKPFKILADPGHGMAGPALRLLEKRLPFAFEFVGEVPDGNFPLGVPDPLKAANQARTSEAVRKSGADFGVAWDGDFDRCFLFDASGRFVDGYYLVGLLGEAMAAKKPGTKIVHDHRLLWNTVERVRAVGGVPLKERTGHVFMKERMRKEDAAYGGELSSHHFFRDFFFCDSGMIPWLLVAELMSKSGKTLAQLVDAAMAAYPCSGDKTYKVADPRGAVERLYDAYVDVEGATLDTGDGLSVEFADWRFNARASNTEPVLRLTLETRGNAASIPGHLAELERVIEQLGM